MKLSKIGTPLIYGTRNRAKLDAMRRCVQPFGIAIEGLPPGTNIPPVDESGSDPLENAQIKASAFYRVLHRPVFSCDSGLFFDGLPAGEQPGTHVRRVQGRELTDNEMIEYYAALAAKHGGRLTARYQNAIYLIMDEEHIYHRMIPCPVSHSGWYVRRIRIRFPAFRSIACRSIRTRGNIILICQNGGNVIREFRRDLSAFLNRFFKTKRNDDSGNRHSFFCADAVF